MSPAPLLFRSFSRPLWAYLRVFCLSCHSEPWILSSPLPFPADSPGSSLFIPNRSLNSSSLSFLTGPLTPLLCHSRSVLGLLSFVIPSRSEDRRGNLSPAPLTPFPRKELSHEYSLCCLRGGCPIRLTAAGDPDSQFYFRGPELNSAPLRRICGGHWRAQAPPFPETLPTKGALP